MSNKCVLCGYLVDWQNEHFKIKWHWYHASCSIKRIEELEAECDGLGGELESLQHKLEARTIALQCAVDMAQDGVLPRLKTYNRWREALGWKAVE